MDRLRNEIKRIKGHRLEYYNSHIQLIEDYIDEKPDISIETCKAIIEGISKLSLHILTQTPLNQLNSQNFSPLFKNALTELQKGRGFSDYDSCNRLGSVIEYIGALRNEHSDISHGRASLKEQLNDADFAELIIGITDNLCTYMLRRLDTLTERAIEYDDNIEFNNYLDDLNPLGSSLSYSKALFDQELESYEIELGDFLIEQESEVE